MQKTITQRLSSILVEAATLEQQISKMPDGADPMRLSGVLRSLGEAVSAAQSRITVKPNETFSRAEKQADDDKTIAELEALWSRPTAPVPAVLEVEEDQFVDRATAAAGVLPHEVVAVIAALNGQPVTLVWDPVLGVGRIDATDAAVTAYLKS